MARLSTLVLFAVSLQALAIPSAERPQRGVVITAPPKQSNLGTALVPDPAHPYIAPGPKDIRGPCPGMNTMANHGYLPRNGIVSFEDIVDASTRAFNMDYTFASTLSAFAMLARGNAFINKVSIGLESADVPPMPGMLDGPAARGLASHGRFEGDVSMTRQDAAIGDQIHFQQDLFDQFLNITARLGDDSPVTGPKSIINMAVMQELKYKRFVDSQAKDKKLQFHAGRLLVSYGEASLILNLFANGTEAKISVPVLTSFFRDQTFPKNWHRRTAPATFAIVVGDAIVIKSAHPILPGANNAQGVYVEDAKPLDDCSFHDALGSENIPAVLLNTTGLLRKNVNFLLDAIHNVSPDCPRVLPVGPANI